LTNKLNFSKRFKKSNKGVGTVFGMVFFLLIVVIVFGSFLTVLNQSVQLEQTMIQTRAIDNTIAREALLFYSVNGANVHVRNMGSFASQIVRLWYEDPSGNYHFVSVPSNRQTIQPYDPDWQYSIGSSDENNKYWIITARGNVFTLQQDIGTEGPPGADGNDGNKWYNDESTQWSRYNPPPIFNFDPDEQVGDYYLNTFTRDLYVRDANSWRWIVKLPRSSGAAGVAQGIGSIAMDFPGFKIYTFNSRPDVGSVLPTPSSHSVSKNSYLVFRVPIWNVDPDGRDIVLSRDSRVWCSITQQSTMKSGTFKLIDVNDNTGQIIALSRNSVTMPYTDDTESSPPTVLYFGYDLRGSDMTNDFPQTVPLNILLYGGISGGTDNYGQNLPFVSIRIY
jgi:hypothetical protein